MYQRKGIGAMLVVIIILALIAASVTFNIFFTMTDAFLTNTFGCDTYCQIHEESQEYGTLAWWPGWLGGSMSWSDLIREEVRGLMARPAAAGCFCGVSERSGKYMHVKTLNRAETISEFHLTKQNPGVHLKYTATGFDHRGGLDECKEIVGDELDGFGELDQREACVIVSVQENDNDKCAIWEAEEGSLLVNLEGINIEETLIDSSMYGDDFDDPVEDLDIGASVGLSGAHPSQWMLLEKSSEGTGKLNFSAPVVCKSSGRNEAEADSELDEACRDYCNDQGMLFWTSTCSNSPIQNYDLLPEEYKEDGKLCSKAETAQSSTTKEKDGELYCHCKAENKYYWEVDEEYEPEEAGSETGPPELNIDIEGGAAQTPRKVHIPMNIWMKQLWKQSRTMDGTLMVGRKMLLKCLVRR